MSVDNTMPEYKAVKEELSKLLQTYPQNFEEGRQAILSAMDHVDWAFDWSRRGGISGYVDSLEHDQLMHLITIAQQKKAEKDKEPKHYVHQVTTHLSPVNFKEDDLAGAVEYIHQSMLAILNSGEDLDEQVHQLKDIRLRSFKERESEYKGWFE